MTRLFFLLLTLVALAQPARVQSVHDGDSLTALVGGRSTRVRLHGIDAPELRQPYGQASRDYLARLVDGRNVELEPHGEDRYGRMLAVVIIDGRSANQELVRAGYAWWFQRYAPSDAVLQRLEAGARAARRGLWTDSRPVAPWDFRHPPGRR